MKPMVLVFVFTFVLAAAPARAETIKPSEAVQHVGQSVTVEGVVAEVRHAASGKATFIDIGGRYPDNPFAVVIFADDAGKFPKVDDLAGKTIDVTGTIKLYRKKPEMILNDAAQLKAK
jgi:DNA/RNA endonuclease YhcR with UshA esterase domain